MACTTSLQYSTGTECTSAEGPADQVRYTECCERILDPGMPVDEARRCASLLRMKDPALFFSTLASVCSKMDEANADRLLRALNLVQELAQYDPLLPWLRRLTEQAPERVQSKAVKLLCKAVPDKRLVERQLRSHDSRVRANAIEALWFHQSQESTNIFRQALSDPSHRVVVNALIGLCYQNDPTASEKLIDLLQHSCEKFRVAAIWAFAHLYDERAIPSLKLLQTDSSEMVRERATKVLAELLYLREWFPSHS